MNTQWFPTQTRRRSTPRHIAELRTQVKRQRATTADQSRAAKLAAIDRALDNPRLHIGPRGLEVTINGGRAW